MAAGSGIPHMRSYINGVDVPTCVAPLTLFVKCVGVTLAIASGLVAGKEGPYIQVCVALAFEPCHCCLGLPCLGPPAA